MYELDLNQPMPLLSWNYVFETLSLECFDKLYRLLRFPIYPSVELQQIARDFVITFAKKRGLNVPFTPTNEFLAGDDTNLNWNQVVFNNVFRLLEEHHFAEVVYNWGIRTHYHFPSKDFDALSAWCRLMNECAVTQVAKYGVIHSRRITSEKVALVVDYWMSIWSKPPRIPDVPPPMLSESELGSFYNIILEFQYEHLELRQLILEILLSSATNWDRFIGRATLLRGWVSLEAKFRRSLDEWNSLASEVNMKAIERWAVGFVGQYRDLIVPMP